MLRPGFEAWVLGCARSVDEDWPDPYENLRKSSSSFPGELVTALEPLSCRRGGWEVDAGHGRHGFRGRVQHQVTFQQALPKARFRVHFLSDQPWAASSRE